ncbi:hypothetical protein PS6_008110 [Mucor atramentarius]
METILDSIANFAYYYKPLKDITRILRVNGQTNNDNNSSSRNQTDSDSSDDGDSNNETGATSNSAERTENNDAARNNNGANAYNDDIHQHQPSQGNTDAPTRAEPEANLDRVDNRQPQSRGVNAGIQITEAISARPLPSSPTAPITRIPTSTILSDLPADTITRISTSTVLPDLPAPVSTTYQTTLSIPAIDSVLNATNEPNFVDQPTTSLPADHMPAITVSSPFQTTSTPTTEAPPIGQSTTNSNQPAEASSNDLVSTTHPTSSTREPSAALPDPFQENMTPSDADTSALNERRSKTTSGRHLSIRKTIAIGPISSIKDESAKLDAPQSAEFLTENSQTTADASQVFTDVPDSKDDGSIVTKRRKSQGKISKSSAISFSEATATAGRIIKPLPLRFRKFQKAKAASTTSSSVQQVNTAPLPPAAPVGALQVIASSSDALEDRGSNSHFNTKKRRTKSASISSDSLPVASSIEELTEATRPATSFSNTVGTSCEEPPPAYPTFNFIYSGSAVINFSRPNLVEMAGNFNVIHQEAAAETTSTQPIQNDILVPDVQDFQPQQDASTVNQEYVQYDTIAPTPHYYPQDLMASNNQHLQKGPSHTTTSFVSEGTSFHYVSAAPPAFNIYNNVQYQNPVATSQNFQYTTTPMEALNSTPIDDDNDGLEEHIRATMNDLFGDVSDSGIRNIYVPDSAYPTISLQAHQHVVQSVHDQSTFSRPINEDIDMGNHFNLYYNGGTMQGSGHTTTAYSTVTLEAGNMMVHNMNPTMIAPPVDYGMAHSMTLSETYSMVSNMINRMYETLNHRATTTTVSTYYDPATNQMAQFVYGTMPNIAITSSEPRNHLRQRAAPMTSSMRHQARNKRSRMRKRLASRQSDGSLRRLRLKLRIRRSRHSLNQTLTFGENFAAIIPGHYRAPEAYSNAEAPTYATDPNITHAGVSASVLNPHIGPFEATRAESSDEDIPIPPANPEYGTSSNGEQIRDASSITTNFTQATCPAEANTAVMTPIETSSRPHLSLFGSDSSDDEPVNPTTANNDTSDSFIDLGSRVIQSPLTYHPSVPEQEPPIDTLLRGLQIQAAAPDPSMRQEAATYDFADDPPLPESGSGSDDTLLEQQPRMNPLDGHGSDFSDNSQNDNSSNESLASASVNHLQPGVDSNPSSLLIASYFSLPPRLRDPRLRDPYGEDSVVNTESDEVDDLVSAAQMVSVDDETIGTPSFFPSPSRQLTPGSVPPANVAGQLPGFLPAGAHITPTPPRGELSTQSNVLTRAESSTQNNPCGGSHVPLRGVFDLPQLVLESAYRKRRHHERDEEEEDEGGYSLNDSLKKLKIDKSKNDKKKGREGKDGK